MPLNRILATLLASLACLGALGANMTERSPFFQGHWWDPARSGSGFEIFTAAGHVMAIWYTYDETGNPIWYTAQGELAEMGNAAWPLQKHSWANGRIATSTTVGDMRLAVSHSEEIAASWSLGNAIGQWTLRPYLASTVVSELDHTGHWFDPTQSGWGFTLTEQGDTLGSVLYAYDPSGAPTWIAGFDRKTGNRIPLYATRGAAPTQPYMYGSAQPAGYIDLEYQGESRLVVHPSLSVPLAADVRLAGAVAVQLGRPASTRAADRQLARFDSQALLKSFLDVGMMQMVPKGSNGGIDFSAPPPSVSYSFSPTNLQEEGVDEADVVKTDGRYVYTFRHDDFDRPVPALRYSQVAAEGAGLGARGSVDFFGGSPAAMDYRGLIVHDSRLAAISGTQPSGGINPWLSSAAWVDGKTYVEIMETSDSAPPATRWRAQIDGHVLSARRVGDTLYLVVRYVPSVAGFNYAALGQPSALAGNRALLDATALASMLPKVSIDGAAPVALLEADSIYAPPTGARLLAPDLTIAIAIDLAQPRINQALAISGSADAVYASPTSLYFASARANLYDNYGRLFSMLPQVYLTDIHRIGLEASSMGVAGTGTVQGWLSTDPDQAPMHLSEHQGRLRVVSTNESVNRLTVLEPSTLAPGLMRTVAVLPNERRPEPLGKQFEELKATRFAGDRLYLVTFRRIDPLYVVDLSQPGDPKVSGSVELPGFSEYLHPLPTGQLLGFGVNSTGGPSQGLQLSLYNVSAAGVPAEVQTFVLGAQGSSSALLYDHHAFSALMKSDGSGSFAFPARIYNGTPAPGLPTIPWNFSGVLKFDLQWATTTELRIAPQDFLVSHRAGQGASLEAYRDPALTNGRSILFPQGTVYVGNGRFWHQDAAGQTTGPF